VRAGTGPGGDGELEPVVMESTPTMIAARIREAIASGVIPPGAQIGEAEFARRLAVSRGPLREGLQRLAQEGLVVAVRNRGHFVIEMTPENVRDMYVARAAVERAAAARAHELNPQGTAKLLLESVAAMKAAADQRDEAGVSTHDIAFHRDLVRCAESPRLTRMHETLMAETRMCIHALTPTYAVGSLRVAEHRRIARSFTKGDPELTDRLLIHHMDDALVRLGAVSGSDSTDELTI
jgi:DNA-binding GntR family transcriptional regulator